MRTSFAVMAMAVSVMENVTNAIKINEEVAVGEDATE